MSTAFTKSLILLTSAAALAACSTINPYTGQQQTSRAVQ